MSSRHSRLSLFGSRRRSVPMAAALVLLLLLASCSSANVDSVAPVQAPTERPVEAPPTVRPTPTVTPEPTPPPFELALTPKERGDWEVRVVTAKPDVTWVDTRALPDGPPADIEWGVWNPTPFGTTLALLVTSGGPGDDWIEVQVPVKPNGSTAWVEADQFTFSSHSFHAKVDLGAHQVTVWDGDDLVVQTAAVVGAPGSPTPVGTFYVNDLVPGGGGGYGPWILSLSAYSEVLESFNGGEPVIAIHGTSQPGLVGQSLSNGCIRVPNDIISLLAETVPLGTPVEIVA